MGTISKHKIRLSLLPASSQLRNAVSYILFTAAALFLLNIYASNTLRSITFQSKRDYLADKAQTVSATLLPLDELSASKTEQTGTRRPSG